MSNKLTMPTRPKPIKLMTEERVNWYLREMDNLIFWNRFTKEEREALKEKLILSLNYYKIPIPDELRWKLGGDG